MHRYLSFHLLLGVLLAISASAQTRWYVDADATGLNDGSSWTDAFVALQDALAASEEGDTLWVAEGVYRPDQGVDVTSGDVSAEFVVKAGMAVYGGFEGTERALHERDIVKYETVFSGDLLQNDTGPLTADAPSRQDNAFRVLYVHSAQDTTTVLNGFTITGAFGTERSNTGGGLRGSGIGSIDYQNLIIVGNFSQDGGGARVGLGAHRFTNTRFEGNVADDKGGGLFARVADVSLVQCVFKDNFAGVDGGAIYPQADATTTIDASVFEGNYALQGGAIYANTADVNIYQSAFFSNVAGGAGGGALTLDDNETLIVNSIFVRNRNDGTNLSSGGTLQSNSPITMINSMILGSQSNSSSGKGIVYQQSDGDILEMHNSIIWHSVGTETGSLFGRGAGEPDQIVRAGTSIIEGGLSDYIADAGGNLFTDPLFTDVDGADNILGTSDDDLTLAPGSPAINAGSAAALPPDVLDLDGDGDTTEPIPFDLAGNARILGSAVDIGAYESPTNVATEPLPERSEAHLHVYPTPTADRFTVRFAAPMQGRLVLYDLLGRSVATLAEGTWAAGATQAYSTQTLGLAPGVYLLRLKTGTDAPRVAVPLVVR